MAVASISDFDLRFGDDDSLRRWGGEVRKPALGDTDVAQLKAALVSTGVMAGKDAHNRGHFDAATKLAVERLQWYLDTVPGYLGADGAFVARPVTMCVVRNGVANDLVRSTLRTWTNFGQATAGNLVRGVFADYANIVAGGGFKYLIDNGQFVVDRGFTSAIAGAQALAEANDLTVHVNQVFRVEGTAVSGAVVTPAGFSAHKIGRAFDVQLAEAGMAAKLSATIRSAEAKSAFGRFRDGMKRDHACRYGGDFGTSDPPHFDRQILPTTLSEWKFLFHFNQRQIGLAKANAAAVPLL